MICLTQWLSERNPWIKKGSATAHQSPDQPTGKKPQLRQGKGCRLTSNRGSDHRERWQHESSSPLNGGGTLSVGNFTVGASGVLLAELGDRLRPIRRRYLAKYKGQLARGNEADVAGLATGCHTAQWL